MPRSAGTLLSIRLILAGLILALLAGTAHTQFSTLNLVVELKEGESVERLSERHQVSIQDAVGDAYLVSGSAPALTGMIGDPAVAGVEANFEVEISESAMLASAQLTWLDGDTVELLEKLEQDQEGASHRLAKQRALDLIGCEDDDEERVVSGRGIRVAVIDTGIDSMHPALAGRVLPGFNLIDNSQDTEDRIPGEGLGQDLGWLNVSMVALLNPSTVALLNPDMVALLNDTRTAYLGHGTLVSGLIRSVAPDALLVPLKAFDSSGHATSFTVARAITYAADLNVDIINMSFDFDKPSKLIQEALDYASNKGIILVASAGNHDAEASVYPAVHPSVIAVASTDREDRKAKFSNYGPAVDVAAPGEGLVSTFPGGHYAAVAGTSFSAALVSGEAALLRSSNVFLPSDVLQRILKSAKGITSQNPGVQLGVGRIRVKEAIGEDDEH